MSTGKYICPNCQGEVNYGDKFCGKCGYRFGDWGASPASNQSENVITAQQPVEQTPAEESGGGSFLAKLIKWAVVILVAGGVLAFVSSFFGKASPQEAIKEGDKEAMETFYNKAKDKTKAKEEIGKAFLEEAYRILDDESLKNNASRQLEAQNNLMKVTEFFVKNDDLKDLLQMSSKFNDIAVANSEAQRAESDVWKKYDVSLNSRMRQIEGYILNRVQNSNSKYQCVDYEYILGNAMPMINKPICILDFGKNQYVTQGVQTVYGVEDKEEIFEDRAGFKTKMMVYKAVDQAGYREIMRAKRLQNNKKFRESEFKRLYPKDFFTVNRITDKHSGSVTGQKNKTTSVSSASTNKTEQDAGYVLKAFHDAITAKQYRTAYDYLGAEMQNYVGGYEKFVNGYSTTISSRITDDRIISSDASNAVIEYTLEARDQLKAGIAVQNFKGKATLKKVEGNWKIVEVTAKRVSY